MSVITEKREAGSALLILIAVIALFRLLSLGLYPLMDTTEARYAEIARKMLELNDWITPWFDYGVPFWGKPPLSFWMTAFSFKVFGVNEFAARLPYFICGLLVVLIVWHWALHRSRTEAVYSVALLSGGLFYFIASGAVMTDMWFLLGTTLSMRGFWFAIANNQENGLPERWLFFVGLAIGLLAKGPLAIVLTGLPIFVWLVFTGNYSLVWTSLPWIRGSLLTMVIALPWYVMAELKTPGFLNYFLIGEHFQRFVTPGWQGDLYGVAHQQPWGTIWILMFVDWLPWSLLFPVMFIYLWKKKIISKASPTNRDWHLYILIWGFAPAVFFSTAGNILWTYVLPGFPGIALLLAGWLANQTRISHITKDRFLQFGLTLTLSTMIVSILLLNLTDFSEKKSAKSMVQLYDAQKKDNEKIVYFGKRPFSATFYSNGKAEQALNLDELNLIIKSEKAFLAIKKETVVQLPDALRSNLQTIGTRGKYQLLYSKQTTELDSSVIASHSENLIHHINQEDR